MEKIFTSGENKSGDSYGIQVNFHQLKDAVNTIKLAIKYCDFPLTSHSGTTFNMCILRDINFDVLNKKGKLMFVFKRKYWTTVFKTHMNYICNEDRERWFSLEDKKSLCKMFDFLNMKITDKWNHENESNKISIVTDVDIKCVESTKQTLDKFLIVCNDFASMGD